MLYIAMYLRDMSVEDIIELWRRHKYITFGLA